ncbi:GNAT family N-acetyltransferase [Pyxidicoccus caerfyrddinensis]|uniref:GNAT family N-acetyltransferase n=1 Tax=Pyxidicoccus caerfyrddinensis TaxID=2709663 RepID=UPI0013DA3A91|nr:GNAT family N-acetyltransferase [Pyxidicoccus caerfyrddinensis]
MRCPSMFRRAGITLGVLLLCPLSALALECELVNIDKGSQRLDLVASVCEGLQDSKSWWLYAGEEPRGDTAVPVKMLRKICKQEGQVVGLYALLNERSISTLELICVAPAFRQEGKGLELLNQAASDVKTGKLQWVSQSDPATQSFYKGLKVSCEEEELGPATNRGTGERYLRFTTRVKPGQPIERKPRLWYKNYRGQYLKVRYDCSALAAFEAIYEDEAIQEMLKARELISQAEPPPGAVKETIMFEQLARAEDF